MTESTVPEMIDPEIAELLARVWSGQGSAEDARRVEVWREAKAEHAAIAALMRRAWETPVMAGRAPDIWPGVMEAIERGSDRQKASRGEMRIGRGRLGRGTLRSGIFSKQTLRGWVGKGIVIVVVLLGGVFRILEAHRISKIHRDTLYVTRIGQRGTIALPDGSQVVLAPQSRLAISTGFGHQSRLVAVTGEALFTVTKAAGAPFIVKVGNIYTRVLGTEFDVRHYDHDAAVQVVVASGRVAMMREGARHPSMVVLPTGSISRVTDSSVTMIPSIDLMPYTAWTKDRLMFRDTPVAEVLTTLGRWYGYEFQIADSTLARELVTMQFNRLSTADALATIRSVLNVTMIFHGNVVMVLPRHAMLPSGTARQQMRDSLSPFTPWSVGR